MESYPLYTKIGVLNATPTDLNHISVMSPSGEFATVNKVTYSVNAHLYRWNDGKFHIGQQDKDTYQHRHSLYMTRHDFTKFTLQPATEPARNKAAQVIEEAIEDFLDKNPYALAFANRDSKRMELESAERAYADAMAAADKLRVARDLAQSEFDKVVVIDGSAKDFTIRALQANGVDVNLKLAGER